MYDVMIPKNVCSNQLDVIHLDVGRMPLAVSFFCCFFWVRSASCAGPWAVVHHLGEAGIRGMLCRFYAFMVCMSHSHVQGSRDV